MGGATPRREPTTEDIVCRVGGAGGTLLQLYVIRAHPLLCFVPLSLLVYWVRVLVGSGKVSLMQSRTSCKKAIAKNFPMQTTSCTWPYVVPIGEDPAAHGHWCLHRPLPYVYHTIPYYLLGYKISLPEVFWYPIFPKLN